MSELASTAQELAGVCAVVTGSTGGIGRAIARELARAGAAVVIHGRRANAAEQVVAEIRSAGGQAEALCGDLADLAGQDALAAAVLARFPQVGVWVNNAGADVLTGLAAGWSFEEKLQTLWQVDVVAALRLSRRIGRHMADAQGGMILNLGWDQAATGMAGDSGELFATVKGAVMAMTRSLAASLAPKVRVNCLAPGWIRTAWGEQATEYWQQRARREALLERWGEPDDIARAARFLCSPASAFVTGQVLPVNGGLRVHAPAPPAD